VASRRSPSSPANGSCGVVVPCVSRSGRRMLERVVMISLRQRPA
jgi:hypothetical protein